MHTQQLPPEQQVNLESRKNTLLELAIQISNIAEKMGIKSINPITTTIFKSQAAHADWSTFHATPKNVELLETYLKNIEAQYQSSQFPGNNSDFNKIIESIRFYLLPKIGKDSDGISKNIANFWHQLKLQGRPAFIELQEEGLGMFWDSQKALGECLDILQCLGIDFVVRDSSDKQAKAPQLADYASATFCVFVSHLHIEKFLALNQFHHYVTSYAVNDFYKARNLNRAACLRKAAEKNREGIESSSGSAVITDSARVRFTSQEDVVAITVSAYASEWVKKTTLPHIVIVLDDSGSMSEENNKKMDAANNSVKQMVDLLPGNTLISLYALNAGRQFKRITVEEIKKNPSWKSLPAFNLVASGGTPLIQAMAFTADFLRADDEALTITDDALNNTVLAVITDGIADNIYGNSKIDTYTLNAMQRSAQFATFSKPSSLKNLHHSYGFDWLPCQKMPMIFFIPIGMNADLTLMKGFNERFHSPIVFVDDRSTSQVHIKDQMSGVFNMITQITNGRIPSAFVALKYINSETKKEEVIGKEIHDIFYERSRSVSFQIPANAESLEAFMTVDGDLFQFYNVSPELKIRPDIIAELLKEEFVKIKDKYNNDMTVINSQFDTRGDLLTLHGQEERTRTEYAKNLVVPGVSAPHDANNWSIRLVYRIDQFDAPKLHELGQCVLIATKADRKHPVFHLMFVKDGQFVLEQEITLQLVQRYYDGLTNETFQSASYDEERNKLKNYFLFLLHAKMDKNNAFEAKRKAIETTVNTVKVQLIEYMDLCPGTPLANEMSTFLQNITTEHRVQYNPVFSTSTISASSSTSSTSTSQSAERDRLHIGARAPLRFRTNQSIEEVLELIRNDALSFAYEHIQKNLKLLAVTQLKEGVVATPLLYAFIHLTVSINHFQRIDLRKFILDVLSFYTKANVEQYQLQFDTVDQHGRTLFHRGFLYGEFDICKKLIEQAISCNKLHSLIDMNSPSGQWIEDELNGDRLNQDDPNGFRASQKQELLKLVVNYLSITPRNTRTPASPEPTDLPNAASPENPQLQVQDDEDALKEKMPPQKDQHPKPTGRPYYDPARGIVYPCATPADAKEIWSMVPAECQDFISFDGNQTILFLNSINKGGGVYISADGSYGMNCKNENWRNEIARIFLSRGKYGVNGGKGAKESSDGVDRSNALYILPEFFTKADFVPSSSVVPYSLLNNNNGAKTTTIKGGGKEREKPEKREKTEKQEKPEKQGNCSIS